MFFHPNSISNLGARYLGAYETACRAVQKPDRGLIVLILSIAFMAFANRVQAEMVYDNGVTSANAAYYSDTGTSGQQIYDNFTLSPTSPSLITGAVWTGLYAANNGPVDNFTIEFWTNGSTTPNVLLSSTTTATVTRTLIGTQFGRDLFEYTAEFDTVALLPSQTYWFSVINQTNGGWAWMTDTTQGQIAYQTSATSIFRNTGSEMDFSLFSTPEPSSFVMFALCLIPTLRRNRRKGVQYSRV